MGVEGYRCALCWRTFDGPGDLAEHEQQEEETLFTIPWEDDAEC